MKLDAAWLGLCSGTERGVCVRTWHWHYCWRVLVYCRHYSARYLAEQRCVMSLLGMLLRLKQVVQSILWSRLLPDTIGQWRGGQVPLTCVLKAPPRTWLNLVSCQTKWFGITHIWSTVNSVAAGHFSIWRPNCRYLTFSRGGQLKQRAASAKIF